MGGYGSGGWSSKNTTSAYLQLDIRRLRRKGFLRPGNHSLQWSQNGEQVGSIGFEAEHDHVVLRYKTRSNDGDWESKEYFVHLDYTACNYGGSRAWFLCPARGCLRRVAVLYGGAIFACRHCHQLVYQSQRDTTHSRALRRSQAIIEKLGGEYVNGLPNKPKGMHWKTYSALVARYEHAQAGSWSPWLLRMLAR